MPIDTSEIPVKSKRVSVDCLMPTLAVAKRQPLVQKSIMCYCRQTYAHKRLLLLINGGDESGQKWLRDYVASLNRKDIVVFEPPAGLNLGQLRNFLVDRVTADLWCNWDDDDLYHPERLERQLAALLEGDWEAVYLQEVLQYFPAEQVVHWTNWRAVEVKAHPGTLMVRREVPLRYPTEGDVAHLGEDTDLAQRLIARGRVGYLAGLPHLYIYVSHGANSYHQGHHRMLADELSISRSLLLRREAQIREGMAPQEFRPGSITVMGSNGVAFVL